MLRTCLANIQFVVIVIIVVVAIAVAGVFVDQVKETKGLQRSKGRQYARINSSALRKTKTKNVYKHSTTNTHGNPTGQPIISPIRSGSLSACTKWNTFTPFDGLLLR